MNALFQELLGAKVLTVSTVGGGCINNAAKVHTSGGDFFLKWNAADFCKMFRAEVRGLALLKEKSPVDVPSVIAEGLIEDKAYLVLPYIEKAHGSSFFWECFGMRLAQQHRVVSNTFGLDHANYIGKLPQYNTNTADWTAFFVNERLTPQLKMAEQRKLVDTAFLEAFDRLYSRLDTLFPKEPASLLHGDLWSGNFLCAKSDTPYIFDPAVFYGHREAELAFTHLFGGFDAAFYQHYESEYPLEQGFQERIDLYNLYPLLVHANLFGASYLSGVRQVIKRFS